MNQLKILIVDDDTLVRIALKTLVNWEENGFTLIGEAGDGKQALEQIDNLSPDIVMLDIQMPIMNGIELLKEISKRKLPPRVVVLSSHDDLDLVKQAMKLGASDYLLKLNIDFNHVIEVMGHIADEIIEERKHTSQQKDLNQHIARNINLLRKNFFKDLLDDFYISEEEMDNRQNILDINFYGDTRYCYVIYAEEFINFDHVKKENAVIRKFATVNIIEEIVGGYCFEWDSGEFVVFTSKQKDSEELSMKEVELNGKRIVEMLHEYLNLEVFLGIGIGAANIQGLKVAKEKAVAALRNRFHYEKDRVFIWSPHIKSEASYEEIKTFRYKKELSEALDFKNEEEIKKVISQILEELEQKRLSKKAVNSAVLNLYFFIKDYFQKNVEQGRELLEEDGFEFENFVKMENISAAKEKLHLIEKVLLEYCKLENSYKNNLLMNAKKFIEEHFTEEISLKDAAAQVNLNPSYFSNLLKKEYGKSFSEYLIELRINKAKQLIKTTDYKMYEISQMVGYPNTFYFTRLFKAKTGMTPGEYKSS